MADLQQVLVALKSVDNATRQAAEKEVFFFFVVRVSYFFLKSGEREISNFFFLP